MPRSGRRAGDGDTRLEILAAARSMFARDGYRATIRNIAAEAGVDPALVMHYFGSKDKLYAASIEIPVDPEALIGMIRSGPHDQIGMRLARLFFTVWEQPQLREPILAILHGAISGHDSGAVAFREFVSTTLLPHVADEASGPNARLHAELAVAQLVGVAVMRYVIELDPVASAEIEEIIEAVGERIQGYFD